MSNLQVLVTYYGVTNVDQIRQIVRRVCDVLGHGATAQAMNMVMRTIAQEAHMGSYPDRTPFGAGIGLCQIDKIAFDDIKARVRPKHIAAIKDAFGFHVDDIEHEYLAFSPLLSIVFCRLFYLMVPEPFPATIVEQARYWKKYYNTEAGKGEVKDFVLNANQYC